MVIRDKKVGVISLGCDKNRVDTEKMLAQIKKRHQIVVNIEDAQILIVNTCAFLKSARQESVREILTCYQYKQNGKAEKIIVTGCLPQKFSKEVFNELTEADAFLGVADYQNINEIIDQIYLDKRINAVNSEVCQLKNEGLIKRVKTTKNYAYLKIADGCYNRCSFCLIPSIRGKYRSIESQKLIKEAKSLGEINELILVAQDTTRYGSDLTPKTTLAQLVRELTELENIKSVRLLYCYPEAITDQLIDEIANNEKVVKYIDVPFQHGDDRILKLMNRRGNSKDYLTLIEKLKSKIPSIAIRSTFMVGFPTEDEQAFNNLLDFIQKANLTNVGFFKYSREEDTKAYNFSPQVLATEKQKRYKIIGYEILSINRNILPNFLIEYFLCFLIFIQFLTNKKRRD